MNTWAGRVKSRMKELGMTQETLANQLGITRGAITHYLGGRRVPPLKQFQKLAIVLKVDPVWLQYGVESERSGNETSVKKTDNKKSSECQKNQIPILTWEQASNSAKVLRNSKEKAKDFLPYFHVDNFKWYGLRVKGDSMVSALGKSFYENDIIIVDPDKKAEHGSYVVAMLPRSKEATFKQFVVDGGIHYLKPLNPQYPIVQVDKKIQICGVIVASITMVL